MSVGGAGPSAEHSKGRTGVVGSLVAVYTFFDALLVGLPILLLASWFNPLVVFLVALVVVTLLDVAACRWVDRSWDAWIAGTAFDRRMEKVRVGKRARRPVGWIERGSDGWIALAAALLNAVQAIALIHLITGKPAGQRRILVASAAWALFTAGIFSLFGFALGDAIQAL
jgi:hypothetical protein